MSLHIGLRGLKGLDGEPQMGNPKDYSRYIRAQVNVFLSYSYYILGFPRLARPLVHPHYLDPHYSFGLIYARSISQTGVVSNGLQIGVPILDPVWSGLHALSWCRLVPAEDSGHLRRRLLGPWLSFSPGLSSRLYCWSL